MAVEPQRSAENSVNIILIGSTGSGKSSTGNTILCNKHFKSEACGKSVTLTCESATEEIFGRQVTVVDTPGWDCTELSEQVVVTAIKKTLENLQKPYSFLLVLSIGSVESHDINKIYGLEKVLGPSFFEHTTILFSHSDNLEFKSFQDFLDEGGEEFQTLLQRCGKRCHSWNNRSKIPDEDLMKVLQYLINTDMKEQQSAKSSEDKIHEDEAEPPVQHKGNCGKRPREPEMVAMDSQESKNPIRVLFLGMTKVGKTSSIKTLQSKCEPTDKDIYKYSTTGLSLQLFDSPGFDEDPREIQKVISEYVSNTKPHVVIIVMSVGRISPAAKRTMQNVHRVLGSGATKYTIMLFTEKDNLEGKPIDAFIEEDADLKKMVEKMNGRRPQTLNNRDASDNGQVDEVLQTIADMYRENEGEFYKPEDHSD